MNTKILIANGNPSNLILIKNSIQRTGYEAITASNGAAVLHKARALQPAIIILDLLMPDMNGFDICKELKESPETKSIFILIVTAADSKENRAMIFQVGADDYLEIPFEESTLHSRLKALLYLKKRSDDLDRRYALFKKETREFNAQLHMAMHLQQAMIANYDTTIHNIHVTSRYMPALEIGGDFYDVIKLNDHAVGVFIADVSGHGISAALLTSMLKLLFRNTAEQFSRPDILLEKMNQNICNIFVENSADVYACAFFAYIDTKTHKISYSNAGHPQPLLVDHSKGCVRELTSTGMPLGLMNNSVYDCFTDFYVPSDSLLFYTDGFSDSLYKDAPEEFMDNLQKLLWELKDSTDPNSILDNAIDYFYNDKKEDRYQNDDISLLLCQMLS